MITRAAFVSACLLVSGCPSQNGGGTQDNQNQPSPNASILPAPLLSADPAPAAKADAGRGGIPADSAGRLIVPEAGPPEPTPFSDDAPLPRDTLTSKEGTGVTLEGAFKWLDVPGPNATPELSNDALKKAREKTALRVSVDLAPIGRMRFAFASPAFPVPQNTELRAHSDHYGHVLVWPDGNAYRALRSGTLRALFSERRADALPLTRVSAERRGKGQLLGLETTKLEIRAPLGDVTLESGNVPGLGRAGDLLCRLILDLVAVDPASKICDEGLTPLKAELRWPKGGKLGFEISAVVRKAELPFGQLFVPPAGASFRPGELPPQAAGVFLTRDDLAAFHTKAATTEPAGESAPGEGLLAVNKSDTIRYVLIDGVAVAWVRPQSEQLLIGPLPGRYSVSWRDFLGSSLEPPQVVSLPARVSVGGSPDAGAPPK